MGLREISLANKQRVVITALDYFIEKGIEKSRVRDIAEDSGLTERSVFRYYKNKAELVLDALMYLWNSRIGEISNYFDSLEVEGLSGKERCLKILIAYVDLFISSRNELIFVQEAEVYLYRMNLQDKIKFDPLISNADNEGPLKKAIKKGIEDKTLNESMDFDYFYSNCFDALLGLLQKMATEIYSIGEADQRKRAVSLCEMLVEYISN